ncbi:MAG: D-alanyl-D-alanine carboxypeptidase [Candidatus Pelagibacter sp.]|nr:D-alanyl-D-alanine carboxypeptidase [Candidatus Pelagibacter sp.]|tara:strand:- start:25092 stop:26231 length:1140 start_codon:yes stop_codon:yes gene_type:complete
MIKKVLFFFGIIFYTTLVSAFETTAKQAYLIDVLSGKVLLKKNENERISPASITKIMTTIVAFELIKKGELKLDEKFKISKKAWRMSSKGYSSMFIMPGDKVSVENLLKGIIIVSGNDACVALAQGIAGTEEEFVNMMNTMAIKIGLNNTKFSNSSGLYNENNFSTAKDIATMSIYLINNFPRLYEYYKIKKFTWDRTGGAPITQGNRNPILYKDMGGDGLKTGHLVDSGYSLAATTKTNERRILSVISGLNSKSERSRETIRLLSFAKNRFDLLRISKADKNFVIKTWNLRPKIVQLELSNDVFLTIPKRQKNKLKLEIVHNNEILKTVVNKGVPISKLNIYYDDKLIKSEILYSSIKTEKENFLIRFINSISYFIWG